MAFATPEAGAAFGPVVSCQNLGVTYSSSTFSVTAADGTALSASNPGYVTLASKSAPGTLVTIPVTANQGFIDDTGSSEIVGNLFGLTTSIAHANAIPFAIYAVSNDNENAISFMCSRTWGYSTSAGLIGTPASAAASTQQSMFAFESITTADYNLNPCLQIGSFRMTMSSSDDWTVQALNNGDGIGNFQSGVTFETSVNQFGAAANSLFIANGGTAPIFNTQSLYYQVFRTGEVHLNLIVLTPSTTGVGAVTSAVALPYVPEFTSNNHVTIGCGAFYTAASTVGGSLEVSNVNTSNAGNLLYVSVSAGVNRLLLNSDWAANRAGYAMMHMVMDH